MFDKFLSWLICVCMCVCVYVYIYIYIYNDNNSNDIEWLLSVGFRTIVVLILKRLLSA